MRVDEITDLLLHLRRNGLGHRLRLHLRLLNREATSHGHLVRLHHGLWVLALTLSIRNRVLTRVRVLVEFAASAALISTTARHSLVHPAVHGVVVELLGWIQISDGEVLVSLISLLSELLGRLPELNVERARSEDVGLVKLLNGFFGRLHVSVQDEILNVSRLNFSLMTSFFL